MSSLSLSLCNANHHEYMSHLHRSDGIFYDYYFTCQHTTHYTAKAIACFRSVSIFSPDVFFFFFILFRYFQFYYVLIAIRSKTQRTYIQPTVPRTTYNYYYVSNLNFIRWHDKFQWNERNSAVEYQMYTLFQMAKSKINLIKHKTRSKRTNFAVKMKRQ